MNVFVTAYVALSLNGLGDERPLGLGLQIDDGAPQTSHYVPASVAGLERRRRLGCEQYHRGAGRPAAPEAEERGVETSPARVEPDVERGGREEFL